MEAVAPVTGIDRRAWSMTEDGLMEHIRVICKQLGLLAFHVRDSRGSWGPGFPDLVIASRKGTLFVECKSMTGTVSQDQRKWRDALTAAGMPYQLWKPSDYYSGTISAELVALSSLPVAVFTSEDMT